MKNTIIKMEKTSEGLEICIHADITELDIYTAFIGLMDVMIAKGNQKNIQKLLAKAYAEAVGDIDKTVS